jgi:hypothetical protein
MANVVTFTKPKHLMPAHWRKHVEALKQTEAEIEALHKRLQQEVREFLDVMKEDVLTSNPSQVVRMKGRW